MLMTTYPNRVHQFWFLQLVFWAGLSVVTFFTLTLWYAQVSFSNIAHTLLQLLIHGLVAAAFQSVIGTMKNFFVRFADSLRHERISPQAVCPQALGQIQIRLAPT